MNKRITLIVSVILIIVLVVFSISQCSQNRVQDKRIIGTWVNNSNGATYVFKENGKVQVLTPTNERSFQASDGVLKISYGSRGDDVFCYEIQTVIIDSEQVEALILWEYSESREIGSALKTYYIKQ